MTKPNLSLRNKTWKFLHKGSIKDSKELLDILLQNRGVKDREAFIHLDYDKGNHDPMLMPDMKKALDRIYKAKKKGEAIAIYGDYDVDGVTSTTLLVNLFKDLGFKKVTPYIPCRFEEGYGVNSKAVEKLAKDHTLMITVDCGIANHKEVDEAKNIKLDVIVTDHHEVIGKIPPAIAIINPKVEKSKYPFKSLAGVGVAFKLAQAVYQDKRFHEWIKPGHEKWLLDLVALGTVADCMPLINENRVFVNFGLLVMKKTRRKGLQQLMKKAGVDKDKLNATSIGFQLGPRINAAGRLGHASDAYKLLSEANTTQADRLIEVLENLNYERRKHSFDIKDQIKKFSVNENEPSVIASSEEWGQGVVGLVAGHIAEETYKPTFLFSQGSKYSTGSVRCYNENINIAEVIAEFEELLVRFGGHANAAGLTLENVNFKKFKVAINKRLRSIVKGNPTLELDSILSPEVMTIQNVKDFNSLEPFGENNPQPLFVLEDLEIKDLRLVGQEKNHLKASFSHGKYFYDSIGFYWGEHFKSLSNAKEVNLAFEPMIDTWNNREKLSLKIIDIIIKS